MLQLFINNIEIDILPSTSINMKLINPMFQYDGIQGSYSMPFNLPATPKNNRIFDYPHKLTKKTHEAIKLPIEIAHSGVGRMKTGTISAKKTNTGTFDCDTRIDGGAMSDKVADSMLNEYFYGGPQEFTGTVPYENTDYAIFPVTNMFFWKDTQWDGEAFIDTVINSHNLTGNVNPAKGKAIVPFPYLHKILRYLFNDLGYAFEDYILSTPPLKFLTIFNLNDSSVYPETPNSELDLIPEWPFNIDLKNHLPDILVKQFLKDITNFLNITFVFKDSKVTTIKNDDFLTSTSYIDLTNKAEYSYNKYFVDKTEGCNITWTLDADDNTQKDIGTIDEANTFYHSETLGEIPITSEMQIGDVAISQFAGGPFEYIRHFQILESMIVDFNHVLKYWNNLEGNGPVIDSIGVGLFQNYLQTGKGFLANTNISTVHDGDGGGSTVIYPECEQTGNFILNRINPVNNAFRLLFYKGETEADTPGNYYGVGGRMSRDESLYLGWYGQQGIIHNYWRHTIAWKQQIDHYIEMNIQFSASDIKNFDFSKKIKIGQDIFIIAEIDVTFTQNKISLAKCKLLPDYNKNIA